jgi:hypothetical protein
MKKIGLLIALILFGCRTKQYYCAIREQVGLEPFNDRGLVTRCIGAS